MQSCSAWRRVKQEPRSVTKDQAELTRPKMGLGRLELPTSRLSDMSRALVSAGQRWKQGDFSDFASVSDGQRRWAMIQVVLQLP